MPQTFVKDPNADLDYMIDWSAFLDGDAITSSVWVLPVGITSDDDSNDATTATIWLQGGTNGQDYPVTNRITTAAGRIEDRTITIQVRER